MLSASLLYIIEPTVTIIEYPKINQLLKDIEIFKSLAIGTRAKLKKKLFITPSNTVLSKQNNIILFFKDKPSV